jgi:AcrR family transcriptional regulator
VPSERRPPAASHPAARGADGRRDRWAEHREARRRELVRAVLEVVRRRGPGVGMDVIAAESGITKQIFYRYFADKADLRVAVGRAVAHRVVGEISESIDAEPDPRGKLAAGIRGYLALIEAEPELYRFVISGAPPSTGPGDVPADPVTDYSTVLGLRVAQILGDLLRLAGRDAGAAEPWGFALVGAVRQAADRWLTQPSLTRDALADYLTEFAWSGLSAGTGPAAESANVRLLWPAGSD